MTIEIHEPELEALIEERMASGQYKTVADVVRQALESSVRVPERSRVLSGRTGLDLIAAMQACPVKEFEFGSLHAELPAGDPPSF